MFHRLQTATAVLLLVLASVFGQAGVMRCLCSGQVKLATPVAQACKDSCCKKRSEDTREKQAPLPCKDGSCFVLIRMDAIDPSVIPDSIPIAVAICPPEFGDVNFLVPTVREMPPSPRHRPPDRSTVPFTILFSSFLI
ncbi:MAG: hypothetical protein R3F19_13665 [Verrucomicrobiales bacterium]